MSGRYPALAYLLVFFPMAFFLGWRNVPVPEANRSGQDEDPRPTSPGPREDEEERQAYQWFDTLGFPDLAACPFVKVATGQTLRRPHEPPQNTYALGFLLSDQEDEFRVLGLDLQDHTFRKTPPGTPEYEAVRHEEADIASLLGDYVNALEQPADALVLAGRQFGARLGECADHFLLARACFATGQAELAYRLWLYANRKHAGSREHAPEPFRQRVSDEIAHALLWRAVLAFGDPSIPRRDLLPPFEAIVQRYPGSDTPVTTEAQRLGWELGHHATAARHYIDLLRRMIAEDEEHARRPPRPGGPATTQERVAELIFRLRDQNGRQWTDPGHCDVFFLVDRQGNLVTDSPAHQLVEIGYDAVPQLIDALEDDRLTRSLGCHRSYFFSHHVLRVGDGALAVLERIAARRFWQRQSSWAGMVKEGQAAETRKQVEAWWAVQQKLGE